MLASSLISAVIAWKIGRYIRFNTKPLQEIVFQDNRDANLRIIFNGLRLSDSILGSIFDIFTEKFGILSRNKEDIIPSPFTHVNENSGVKIMPKVDFIKLNQMKKEFDVTIQDLSPSVENMKKQRILFLRDYHLLQNYFRDSFLRDVNQYLWLSTEYVDALFKNDHEGSTLIRRKDLAIKIIQYLESDQSIDKFEKSTDEFITAWKETLNEVKF